MDSREKILAAVAKNKPLSTPLPNIELFDNQIDGDFATKFAEMLQKIGGQTVELKPEESIDNLISDYIKSKPIITNVVSNIEEKIFCANINLSNIENPHELKNIDLAILQGEFGVAENGAIWICGSTLVHNAIPFITQHLVLVINKCNIVENMHIAYQRIKIYNSKYGVFIAGPSKTADIEQSLVIGAHGARSLLVILN